jgi:hypothetical protein
MQVGNSRKLFPLHFGPERFIQVRHHQSAKFSQRKEIHFYINQQLLLYIYAPMPYKSD